MSDISGYLPRYLRVQRELIGEIEKGSYSPHEQLPAIAELSRIFATSDQTIKRALRGLVRDGYIYTINGRGSFVADPLRAASAAGELDAVPLIYTRGNTDMFDSQFYSAVLRGIEEELTAAGLGLELVMTQRISVEQLIIARVNGGLQAAIVASKLPDEAMAAFVRLGRATVSVNIEYPPMDGLYCVTNDEEAAVRTAVEHLHEVGCRKIGGLMVSWDASFAKLRLAAFLKVHEEYYGPGEPAIELGDFDQRTGFNAMYRLLQDEPDIDGVFSANDDMAIGGILAAMELGRETPRDLKVVGFDDIESARIFRPSLTTLHVDREELGRQSVRELLRRWKKPSADFHVERIAPKLLKRESTGFEQEPLGAATWPSDGGPGPQFREV